MTNMPLAETLTEFAEEATKSDMNSQGSSDYLLNAVFAKAHEVFDLPSATEHAAAYQHAQPYPNLVIDGFFRASVLQRIQAELVRQEVNFSQVFTDDFQTNKTISTGDDVPPLISVMATKFASPMMLKYLEELTGIKGLVPDPYYNTDYGYYHIVGAGGILGSHVDHSRHDYLKMPHVLNLVVYLTPDWDDKDGGSLCLFDASGRNVEKRVACQANRAVIFACTPTAYHGVEPVAASTGRRRHSLYFAYYVPNPTSALGVEGFPADGATSNTDASANYSTYFVVPFSDLFRPRNWTHLRTRLIYLAYLLLPPIVVRGVKAVARFVRQ